MAPPTTQKVAAPSRPVVDELPALAGFVCGVVTLIDPDGTCRWVSPALSDVLGWPAEDRAGRNWFELLHPADVRPSRAQLAEVVAAGAGRARLRPYRLRAAGGGYVWVEPQVAVLGDPLGPGTPAMLLVEREVDALAIAEQRTRAAQEEQRSRFEELAHVNRELERFAAVAAHDLAAPLLVVSNYAAMLGGQALTPEQTDYIGRITRTVERMQRLIEDLRRFALADAPLELVDVPLGEVLEEVRETLAPLLDERRARVSATGPLPVVRADRSQLTQLLQNLSSNAIKFGPALGGVIRVSAERASGAWRVSVADGGCGIAREDRQRIFEPFRRLRGSGHLAGTGLGLTIAQRVARNHGGLLALDSLPGVGSTFFFTLPDPDPESDPTAIDDSERGRLRATVEGLRGRAKVAGESDGFLP